MSKECTCKANLQEIRKLGQCFKSPMGIHALSSHQKAKLFMFCHAVIDCKCWKDLTDPNEQLAYVSTIATLGIAEGYLEDAYLK